MAGFGGRGSFLQTSPGLPTLNAGREQRRGPASEPSVHQHLAFLPVSFCPGRNRKTSLESGISPAPYGKVLPFCGVTTLEHLLSGTSDEDTQPPGARTASWGRGPLGYAPGTSRSRWATHGRGGSHLTERTACVPAGKLLEGVSGSEREPSAQVPEGRPGEGQRCAAEGCRSSVCVHVWVRELSVHPVGVKGV